MIEQFIYLSKRRYDRLDREKIKYMRGDIVGAGPDESPDAIGGYIHTYYEDIELVYQKEG